MTEPIFHTLASQDVYCNRLLNSNLHGTISRPHVATILNSISNNERAIRLTKKAIIHAVCAQAHQDYSSHLSIKLASNLINWFRLWDHEWYSNRGAKSHNHFLQDPYTPFVLEITPVSSALQLFHLSYLILSM